MSEIQLSELFKIQHEKNENIKIESEKLNILCFTYSDCNFFCSLEYIREVLEILPISPYPVSVAGHIGVINLRGRIIPVIELEIKENKKENFDFSENGINHLNHSKYRIVVFETQERELFAIMAKNITKKITGQREESDPIDVISVDNLPYRLFNPNEYLKTTDPSRNNEKL